MPTNCLAWTSSARASPHQPGRVVDRRYRSAALDPEVVLGSHLLVHSGNAISGQLARHLSAATLVCMGWNSDAELCLGFCPTMLGTVPTWQSAPIIWSGYGLDNVDLPATCGSVPAGLGKGQTLGHSDNLNLSKVTWISLMLSLSCWSSITATVRFSLHAGGAEKRVEQLQASLWCDYSLHSSDHLALSKCPVLPAPGTLRLLISEQNQVSFAFLISQGMLREIGRCALARSLPLLGELPATRAAADGPCSLVLPKQRPHSLDMCWT